MKPELTCRQKAAATICREPQMYMVCEGCESIIRRTACLCPNCHGYRFDRSKARVQQVAIFLGNKPTSERAMDYEQ